MISGTMSETSELSGNITIIKPLEGSISKNGGLFGTLTVSSPVIPYYETSNSSGGTTVYIGKAVENDGL